MNGSGPGSDERRRINERALGWAMRLVPVEPTIGAAAGFDITLSGRVSGMDALGQSLTLAMVTLRDSDVFNVRFGFRGLAAIAEETDPVLRRERLRLAVIEVLQDEPRVRRIIAVRFPEEMADAPPPTASPVVPPRVLSIEAEFETVAGERQVIVLGGQVLDVR